MPQFQFLSTSQSSDERTIVTSDDHSTSACFIVGFDLVETLDTFAVVGGLELSMEIVVADAAGVDY